MGFEAIVLTKISNHPAPTEGATWAVGDDLFDLIEGLSCAGNFLGTSRATLPARFKANSLYLPAYYLEALIK